MSACLTPFYNIFFYQPAVPTADRVSCDETSVCWITLLIKNSLYYQYLSVVPNCPGQSWNTGCRNRPPRKGDVCYVLVLWKIGAFFLFDHLQSISYHLAMLECMDTAFFPPFSVIK